MSTRTTSPDGKENRVTSEDIGKGAMCKYELEFPSIAAEYDEYEILEYLFSRHSKAVGNYPVTQYNDVLGDTAIHLAAKYAGSKVLKFLLNTAMVMS